MARDVLTCQALPMSNFAIILLTEDERSALEASCRRRKVEGPFSDAVHPEGSQDGGKDHIGSQAAQHSGCA